jgi:hypothetical protein
MATILVTDATQAIDIARSYYRRRLKQEAPGGVSVRRISRADLDQAAEEVEQLCQEPGVREKPAVQRQLRNCCPDREYWVVLFEPPADPPGSASTAHSTAIRVFDTGEAEFGL